MVTNEDVKSYIQNMYEGEAFLSLKPDEQEKITFSAKELLKDNYHEKQITERVVALQVLHMLDQANDEGYEELKQQGIESYSVKGVSVSFSKEALINATYNSDAIAPAVKNLLGFTTKNGAKVSRLI